MLELHKPVKIILVILENFYLAIWVYVILFVLVTKFSHVNLCLTQGKYLKTDVIDV